MGTGSLNAKRRQFFFYLIAKPFFIDFPFQSFTIAFKGAYSLTNEIFIDIKGTTLIIIL